MSFKKYNKLHNELTDVIIQNDNNKSIKFLDCIKNIQIIIIIIFYIRIKIQLI